MKSFFQILQENISNIPERIIMRSEEFSNGCTYKELDTSSNKVCAYLKKSEIKKEDYVIILLPRKVSAVVSLVGVWKCGACAVLLEEDYPSERVSFIKDELKASLVISTEIYNEMMSASPCDSYEYPNDHDACVALYTSGSTGTPKGIIHEFGRLDTFDYDYNNSLIPACDSRFALVTPLNFAPSIRNIVYSLMKGKTLYIVPRNIVKNPRLLREYFEEHKINESSATSSLYKMGSFETKYMKNVFVHSEPCNGVYSESVNVVNLFALSEVLTPVYSFVIDKKYDNSPLGYPNKNLDIKIINEKGLQSAPFEVGEIVIEDKFTRGYINPGADTTNKFSGGYYHTGDLAYIDDNGMAFYSGRKDDMIKINGNRVEPLEIEKAIRQALEIDNVIAKGFSNATRSFVAAYFILDELERKKLVDDSGKLKFSSLEMKDKLQNILPDYMVPAYYVVLDDYPRNINGKISRRDLAEPIAEDYLSSNIKPESELEEYFCNLFAKALGIKAVGALNDFYQIGGDSMSSLMLTSICDRFDLTINEIYNLRTPRNLADYYKDIQDSVLINYSIVEANNIEALKTQVSLPPEMQGVFETQAAFPDYNFNNITRFYKLKDGVDVRKLKDAIDKALKNHPVFSSVIINNADEVKLSYNQEYFSETKIIELSKEELEKICGSELKPFELTGSPLYRSRIFTCEGAAYFYLEVHHIITDGQSLKLLLDEVKLYYEDENAVPATDYYYLFLSKMAQKNKIILTFDEIKDKYLPTSTNNTDNYCINIDKEPTDLLPRKYERIFAIKKELITSCENYKKYKGNTFFLTCFLKAISIYNNSDNAFAFWVYGGRESALSKNAHGMLIQTMPMDLSFNDAANIDAHMESVKECINKQIASCVSFVDSYDERFIYTPYFLYQKDILDCEGPDSIFCEHIPMREGAMPFEFHMIDNSNEDNFRCKIKYSSGIYNEESINKFCDIFESIISSEDQRIGD